MSKTPQSIIFDVDNTLVPFMRVKRIAVEGAAEAMLDAGVNLEFDYIIEQIYSLYWKHGIEDQNIFERFLKKEFKSIDYAVLGCAIAGYRQAKSHVMATYPRTRPTLIELIRRGYTLGIVSDAPRTSLYTRVATLKLNKYFDHIVTADDVGGKHKPDPAPFLKICEVMNIKPEQALMIGDWDERDMIGAKNVGMTAVFARYGDIMSVKDPHADYILENGIYEILDVLKEIEQCEE